MRIDRVRVFRIRRSRNKAGQIPVVALLHNVIVVGTGNNTACLLKIAVRIASHFNYLNPFNGLCPGAANVVHRHKRVTRGVAENNQLIGFGGIVIEDGIKDQRAAVAGVIFIDGKRLPRFAVSMPKVHHRPAVQRQVGERGTVGHIPNCITHLQRDNPRSGRDAGDV